MIEDLIEVRAAEQDELNFVRHSWLRSLRSYEPFYRNMAGDTFFTEHGKRADAALDRGYCLVVSPRDHPKIISGYIVWETTVINKEPVTLIHYIYIKEHFRKMGIASLLIETINTDRKFIASARGIAFRDMDYNPYLLDKICQR